MSDDEDEDEDGEEGEDSMYGDEDMEEGESDIEDDIAAGKSSRKGRKQQVSDDSDDSGLGGKVVNGVYRAPKLNPVAFEDKKDKKLR